jgi:UDP-N-acetylmuramate dehydrogenase
MEIKEHVALAPYTTLKVGGPARFLAEVTSVTDIQQARQFATQADVPVLVLGQGSNVLVSENGFPGLVLINQQKGIAHKTTPSGTTHVTAGAGEDWDTFVAHTVSRGLWGVENLSHIPGTVGATPVQNVGAYGVEVSRTIVSVPAVYRAGFLK